MSQRRACRVIGQPRASQRYQSVRPDRDAALAKRIGTLAADHPRYGYRRIWALLRGGGPAVNLKRVHRLWREAGLQVRRKATKRRRAGSGENSTVRLKAEHPNHVWSYDFVFDTTEDGRAIKLLPIVDDYTRECLALACARSIASTGVTDVLERLIGERGAPQFVRSDNGPEFIAEHVADYLNESNSQARHIDRGAPWQNGYVESFNGKLRDELLGREIFTSLHEAQVLTESWRRHYNERRPHSALGYLTPSAYAASLTGKTNLQLTPALT